MPRHPVRHSQDPESYLEWESYRADGSRMQAHEYPLTGSKTSCRQPIHRRRLLRVANSDPSLMETTGRFAVPKAEFTYGSAISNE